MVQESKAPEITPFTYPLIEEVYNDYSNTPIGIPSSNFLSKIRVRFIAGNYSCYTRFAYLYNTMENIVVGAVGSNSPLNRRDNNPINNNNRDNYILYRLPKYKDPNFYEYGYDYTPLSITPLSGTLLIGKKSIKVPKIHYFFNNPSKNKVTFNI